MAADQGYTTTMSKLGFGALTFTSVLAIYNSWGDASSVAFVLAADDAALVLLFLCLRAFEQGGVGRDRDTRIIKAAVWAITALLTAMSATRGAAIMPLAVGALVFICLRDVDHVRGGGIHLHGQYYALIVKVCFAVLTCSSTIDAYHTRRDPGAAAFVLVSYVTLVILIGLFLRAFSSGHVGKHGQG